MLRGGAASTAATKANHCNTSSAAEQVVRILISRDSIASEVNGLATSLH